jgi:hypothetical protein
VRGLRSILCASLVETLAPYAVVAASLLAIGCGGDFDPGSRITDLRVLAVAADKSFGGEPAAGQAYATPGEKVNLQALWYAPAEDKRTRMWVWAYCVNPSATTVLGCMQKIAEDLRAGKDPATFISVPAKDKDTHSVVIPSDALEDLPEEARKNSTVGILTIVCPGDLNIASVRDIEKGSIPIQCRETVDAAGNPSNRVLEITDFVVGIKRIFVRTKDRNANPAIAKVTWDGADWPIEDVKEVSACETDENRFDRCDGAEQHEVRITLADASFEKGTDEFGTDFEEQLIAQFYATEGLFEDEVRVGGDARSKWVARAKAKGAGFGDKPPLTMWLVARDNRGGVAWVERKVKVRP